MRLRGMAVGRHGAPFLAIHSITPWRGVTIRSVIRSDSTGCLLVGWQSAETNHAVQERDSMDNGLRPASQAIQIVWVKWIVREMLARVVCLS